MDILSQSPPQADAFLKTLQPAPPTGIAKHPLDRARDLFFLGVAEHLALVLPPETNESLLLASATPYLGIKGDVRLIEMFEAAHSVMLAVLAAPQDTNVFLRHHRAYIDTISEVFPATISVRQFRLAIRTLVRIGSPPSAVSGVQPLLAGTILELVRHRMESASTVSLPQAAQPALPQYQVVSEKSACMLAIIDCLPMLPTSQLEEWLQVAAEALHTIPDPAQVQVCRERFWEVLSNGEMDVNRAALCVAWWGTQGGQQLVMGTDEAGPLMSGALIESSRM